ncbi:hypothetical protein BRC64_07025 [Halobacteriales archaeon QH_10_67_22]|nr:MAG: hypothetical protein BRC64_07025 [Halobacteriales archaeon QH_10_67_22]
MPIENVLPVARGEIDNIVVGIFGYEFKICKIFFVGHSSNLFGDNIVTGQLVFTFEFTIKDYLGHDLLLRPGEVEYVPVFSWDSLVNYFLRAGVGGIEEVRDLLGRICL